LKTKARARLTKIGEVIALNFVFVEVRVADKLLAGTGPLVRGLIEPRMWQSKAFVEARGAEGLGPDRSKITT
jgi:hypothetical protein